MTISMSEIQHGLQAIGYFYASHASAINPGLGIPVDDLNGSQGLSNLFSEQARLHSFWALAGSSKDRVALMFNSPAADPRQQDNRVIVFQSFHYERWISNSVQTPAEFIRDRETSLAARGPISDIAQRFADKINGTIFKLDNSLGSNAKQVFTAGIYEGDDIFSGIVRFKIEVPLPLAKESPIIFSHKGSEEKYWSAKKASVGDFLASGTDRALQALFEDGAKAQTPLRRIANRLEMLLQ